MIHARGISRARDVRTHLHEFVGPLFPLLAHRLWWWAGEHAGGVEDGAGETDQEDDAAEDAPTLAWWDLSSWAVWAESDPVCCCHALAELIPRLPPFCLNACSMGGIVSQS